MLGRHRAVGSANTLSLLLALFLVVACGDPNTTMDPTGTPPVRRSVPSRRSTPTRQQIYSDTTMDPTGTPPTATSGDPSRQERSTPTRQQIYEALDSLQIGFLPLNRHTDEFYSTMLPNGEISVDIFGLSETLEAVELWFSVDVPAEKSYSAIEALVRMFVRPPRGRRSVGS